MVSARSFLEISRDYRFEDTFAGAMLSSQRRSLLENLVKVALGVMLGNSAPAWFSRAGRNGMRRIALELPVDHAGRTLIDTWMTVDRYFVEQHAELMRRLTDRLHKGYELFADRFVASFQNESRKFILEEKFLKQIAVPKGDDDPILKRARKYRQLAALSLLAECLKRAAQKYGSTDFEVSISGTTLVHATCGTKNPAGADVLVKCKHCSVLYDQDENASVNIAIAAVSRDPQSVSAA